MAMDLDSSNALRMDPKSIDVTNLTPSDIQRSSRESLIIIGDELGIEDYKNIADLKLQILLNILKKKNVTSDSQFYSEEMKTKKERLLDEDKSRREFLYKYIEKIENIYKKIQRLGQTRKKLNEIELVDIDDPLNSRIKNEFKNFEQQLENIKKTINQSFKCAVLVCGDSGSGKSSFINLLVKREILPVSIRNNTACQVRLTFGQDERAEVIERDGTEKTIAKDKFDSDLKTYIQKFERRDEISCNLVTIYLNSPILEGGLDIYDTIGLGESSSFDDHLLKDMNNITGVLFLLKKNNPIGESTVGGLSKVINHIMTNEVPGCSMKFIVNMCDQLDKSEDIEDLKRNVKKQINERCNRLNAEVITFSAKQELYFQRNNVVSENYQYILKHIQELYMNSVNTKTVLIYEFMNNFVTKSIDCIVESEKFTEDDKLEKRYYLNTLKNLVEKHKKSNESFTKKSNGLIQKYYDKYSIIIRKHFNQESTKEKIIKEIVQNEPEASLMWKIDEIDSEIDTLTHSAFMKKFKEFVVGKNILKNCSEEMLKLFQEQYVDYLNNKNEYIKILVANIDSTMTRIENDLKMTNFTDLLALSNDKRKFVSFFVPLIIPVVQMTNKIKRGFGKWYSFVLTAVNRSNAQKYLNNSKAYIATKSNKYYKIFFSKNIDTVMNSFFGIIREVSKNFREYLEENMHYLMKNISLLEDDMRKREMVINTYKDIKSELESIREDFCGFYLLHYQKDKYNVMIDEIDSDMKAESELKPIPVLRNRNRVVYNGNFKEMDKTDSSILVFKNLDKKTMKDLYLEYIEYREIIKLAEKNFNFSSYNCFMKIRFHILSKVSDKYLYPMFIINGIDYSLRNYIDIFNSETSIHLSEKSYNEISRLLKQILNGLRFLHGQTPPLNHYDLTIDSIGYNSTTNGIKLLSISNETKVLVDYEQTSTTYIKDMSHLPKKILERNSKVKYSKETDIYCLGTILHYAWTGILPLFDVIFDKQIDTIDKLVHILNHRDIHCHLLPDLFKSDFGRKTLEVCKKCWIAEPEIEELYIHFNS